MKKYLKILLFALCMLCIAGSADAQILAFPGAEGHGRFTTGGRGGKVVRVTNLDDNASNESIIQGSLRWAFQQSGTKTIVFDVSGTIMLKQQLKTGKDNITIAGQTSPGKGICVAGHAFVINSNNIIIRYVRFRPGDASGQELDGLGGMDKKNIIIDHCSVSWSVDECLSVYGMENLTVQWSLASEALRVSVHGKGTHCYGGNWGGNKASYHHNMIAHAESRTPRLGPRPSTQENEYVDIRNNVFYNWAGEGCYGAEGMKINMVNNYYKPGPATDAASSAVKYRIAKIGVRTTSYVTSNPSFKPMEHVWGKFYITGNKVEGNSGVTNDNWTNGVYAQQSNGSGVDNLWTQTTKDTIRLSEPLDVGMVTTHTADLAYERVLSYVGTSLSRDDVDERIVSDVRNRAASFTASGNKKGYINSPMDTKPTGAGDDWTPWLKSSNEQAPIDSDGDGIPDYWEEANGLDKNKASDANLTNAEGYTNLELYLNGLVEHITIAQNEGGVNTGIEDQNSENELSVYAYASFGSLSLKNLPLPSSTVEIYSVNGVLVSKSNIQDEEVSYALSSGLYIVRIVSGNNNKTLKVVLP